MDVKKTEQILTISFCALLSIPILFIFRFADNNTFTSWRWVFSGINILHVFLLLVVGVFCAFLLSRLPLYGTYSRLFLFVLSYAAIIPLWNTPESIIDASRYFLQAKALKEHGIRYFLKEWGHGIDAWTDMPLIPFLYGIIFKFFGEARIYIQIFNTLLFSIAVLLTSLIGRELWDEETGFNAGLFLLGIPYLLTQAPLMLVDIPVMFLMSLSIYTFLNAVKKGGIWIAFSSLSISLTIFSKYSAWLMLSVIPVTATVFTDNTDRKKIFRRALTVITTAMLLSAPVFYAKYGIFTQQIEILRTYQWSGLGRWQESFTSTFLFQTHPFVTALALYSVYRALRNKDKRFLTAGWFFIIVLFLQIKRIRYMIPLFPLFALMASYGINKIEAGAIRRFAGFCAAASSVVIVLTVYLPFLNQTGMANLKKAGEYLDTLKSETVEVYALPQRMSTGNTFAVIPILDYFTDKKIFSPQEWSPAAGKHAGTSSLRFTWEMKKPFFYSGRKQEDCGAVLVISSDKTDIENKYALQSKILKRFELSSDVFRFQTFITISNNCL